MGLATIDPQSLSADQALQNSISLVQKDPKVSKIQPFENVKIYKEMYAFRWPYISLLILTFLNGCISIKTSLINTKLGDFVNHCKPFLTTPVTTRYVD